MNVKIKISKEGKPVEGINAMVIDGPASWTEIAATSNEKGEIALPVSESGTYKVKLFFHNGAKEIEAKTGKTNNFLV